MSEEAPLLSVQKYESPEGEQILLHGEEDHSQDGLSYFGAATLMTAQMLGVGLLSTPVATAQSGWIGLILLFVAYILAWVNANLIASIMLTLRRNGVVVRDYSQLGERVCGRVGLVFATAAQYALLAGASIIFLILIGDFMNQMVCAVPSRFFMLVAAALSFGVVVLIPKLKKAKPLAVIAVSTMWSSVLIIVVLSIIYLSERDCSLISDCPTCHTDVVLSSIPNGFGSYAFAFSVHASIPNFAAEMKHQPDIRRANAIAFTAALILFALPLCVFSYLAYGRSMLHVGSGTIVDAISIFTPQFSGATIAVRAILIGHLVFALPIILTPVLLFSERTFLSSNHSPGTRSVKMIILRLVVILILTLIAFLVPYFQPVMSIVSDISVVLLIYILPPAFYFWFNRTSLLRCSLLHFVIALGLILVILYGFLGSAFGLRIAVPDLINAVTSGGNPFTNFFTFGCQNTVLANHSGFNTSVCFA